MTSQSISAAVHQHILDRFLPGENPETLTRTTPLITSGLLDSLNVLELVSYLEEQFHVHFEARDLDRDRLDTIDAIESLVREKLTGT